MLAFPRLVYKSAASYLGVASMLEYGEALKAGWFGSVPEAVAGKHAAPVPEVSKGVTVFKEPGPAPDADGVSRHTAADQDEAEALIVGDGWHATAALAHMAALAASWPAPEAVAGIMADLSRKTKAEVFAYAVSINAPVSKGDAVPVMLEAVKMQLEAGPPK